MAKIVVECSNPNDLDEVEAIMDQVAGRCNITYFKQHEAMVEAGTSKSERESSRIISEDTDESSEAVRQRIIDGKKKVVGVQPKESQPTETIEDTAPEIIKDRHPQGGGRRDGAGRKKSSITILKNTLKKITGINEYIRNEYIPSDKKIPKDILYDLKTEIHNLKHYIDQIEGDNDEENKGAN